MIEERWTQPTTAPKQPDAADEALEDVDDDSMTLASRSHTLPWMEVGVPPSHRRKVSALDVFTAIVVVAFLVVLLLALPLLLLQTL